MPETVLNYSPPATAISLVPPSDCRRANAVQSPHHGGSHLSPTAGNVASAALACALFAFAGGPADAGGPFAQLDGSWSGSGRINLSDGKSEGLKCRAYYTPKGGGAEIGVALRCASASNNFELRANLASAGRRVSGSWEERTFNASGTVTGQASPTLIMLAINGGGFSGSMAVTTTGRSQAISVSTQGVALKGVSVNLQRD